MIPIGLIAGIGGALGNMYSTYKQNEGIKEYMKKIKAPGTEGLKQAEADLAQAKNAENALMPGMQEYLAQIERNKASTIASAERGGENTLLAAAAASGQASDQAGNLAQQQAQYKLQARQQGMAASQGYQNALNNQQQQYNDYLQSLMSAQSSLGQNTAAAFTGLSNLGGGIMGNTAYMKGKDPGFKGYDFLGKKWG